MTFSQHDILVNLTSMGALDCEVLGGDDSYPTWDGESKLVAEKKGDDLVVTYNKTISVVITPGGHTSWHD